MRAKIYCRCACPVPSPQTCPECVKIRILLSFSRFVKVFAVRGRVAQVRSCPFLSLALDGANRGEDTTIVRNRNVNRRGVPQASVLRLGVCILTMAIDPVS
jgi:hypothetical protein